MADNLKVDESVQQLQATVNRVLPQIADNYERMKVERTEAVSLAKKYHDAFNRLARSAVKASGADPDTPQGAKALAAIRATFL